jgi:hypothetical protein
MGMAAQQMRHNEKILGTSMTMLTQAMSYYQRTNSRLTDTVDKMIEERLSTVELIESLRSQDFERRRQAKLDDLDDASKHEIIGKLTNLLPVVVAKLTGKTLPPGEKSEREHLIDSLVDSIQPEQLEQLQGTLRPDQLMVIVNLLETRQKEEEERQKPRVEVVK